MNKGTSPEGASGRGQILEGLGDYSKFRFYPKGRKWPWKGHNKWMLRLDDQIQVLGRSLWLCPGKGCEEERGQGEKPGEDVAIVRRRNDCSRLDQHGDKGRKEADMF